MFHRPCLFALALLVFPALGLAAEPKAPLPPAEYDVLIRYYLEGFRNERILQFQEMKRFLADIGFQEDPDDAGEPLDPKNTRIHGSIASGRARNILAQRHVVSIRLQPRDKPPEDKAQPVRVHLELYPGLDPLRQRLLRDQVLQVLKALDFKEGAGYDDRGFTRVVGSLPAGQVETAAGDLRRHPAGWGLLSRTMLSDLRNSQGGTEVLRHILDDWYDHPQGKKLVQAALNLWRVTPPGGSLLAELPAEVVNSDSGTDRTTVEVRLLYQLIEHPSAVKPLADLLADVLKSPGAHDLMDLLIKRLSARLSTLDLPLLFRTPLAVRVVEVFPGMPLPVPRPPLPEIPAGQEKFTPDLRELLADPALAETPLHLEVILAFTPEDSDLTWRRLLFQTASALDLEGRLGPVVTVKAPAKAALALGALPEVAVVRLPRLAQPQLQVDPARARENFQPLQMSGVARLHQLGQRGKGQRAAVIDSDFRGWRQLLGHQLPAHTRLLDLTRERNLELEPDKEGGPTNELGQGTRCALALIKAAPAVELSLIRIDPGSPYMVQTIARAINGDLPDSIAMGRRLAELDRDRVLLGVEKDKLLEDRRIVLDNFGVEDNDFIERESYWLRQSLFDMKEQEYQERVQRFLQLQKDVRDLKGVRIVASALLWPDGYPTDGTSTLSRYFDDRPFRGALWFQAAGNTRGQAWSGLFRDANGNAVMEFAPMTDRLPRDSWTRELNFLAWRDVTGATTEEVPANTRLRLTLQWREAHDPEYLRNGEDPYLKPLARLKLVLLYQPDPRGEKQPSDDLEVVAETVGEPQRLDRSASAGTYEHVLEFRTTKPGRYVVRVEGRAPEGVRPADAPVLPGGRRVGELYPRLFVETLQAPSASAGQAVLRDFATEAGSLGMPADAQKVITVGAVDVSDQREAFSAGGPLHGRELLVKPDVLAYDQVEDGRGTGLAAGFAAGLAATSMNPDTNLSGWLRRMQVQPGEVLRIPDVRGKR